MRTSRAVPIVDAMAALVIMDHYLRHKSPNYNDEKNKIIGLRRFGKTLHRLLKDDFRYYHLYRKGDVSLEKRMKVMLFLCRTDSSFEETIDNINNILSRIISSLMFSQSKCTGPCPCKHLETFEKRRHFLPIRCLVLTAAKTDLKDCR